MHTIARELNQVLEHTVIADLLSDLGKRMYFPKGIVSQEAEASLKAKKLKATVGMATKQNIPMYLPSIFEDISSAAPSDVFPYASTAGDQELRKLWLEEMAVKNPDLRGKTTSLPVVTSGLTHGIFLAGDLFLDEGDTILVPDLFWGNYTLIFEERSKAKLVTFPFYNQDKSGLDLHALEQAIANAPGSKVSLIVNFPNNPSGYSPTVQEAQQIVAILKRAADGGKRLAVITDDAYFGLFYEEGTCTQSLFAMLADAHEHILAIKVDGATKEDFVWGFRIGFITFGAKGVTSEQYEALVKKTMGAVRSSISNASKPAQSLILKGMKSSTYHQEKQQAFDLLQSRYVLVKDILKRHADDDNLVPLPFNSGYFMAFACKGSAEELRLYLLDRYEVGAIAIKDDYLRIAFSSVDNDRMEELFDIIYQAAGELWN